MGPLAIVASLLALFWVQIGHASGGLDLAGEAPHITEQPLDVTVARHQPATLNCRAGGAPPPAIRWYKNGAPFAVDPHKHLLADGALYFLRASHGRANSDAGVYWCEATNAYGTARSRNATLSVAVLRDEFRLEPASTQTAQGETVLLECAPPRGSPEPTLFWKKNGETIHFVGDSRMHLVDGGSLVIQDARQSDAGRYQCIARNAAGSRESVEITLKVHIKPYLITGPEDMVVQTGRSVTFQCRVGGEPVPDILWRRAAGGGNMPLGRVHITDDRSLRLETVTIADEGEYTCEADNSVGAVSATGYLTVHDPPTISLKKTTVNVEVGSEANFECLATGRPEPIMFWSLEGNRSLIFPGSSRGRYRASFTMDGVTKLTISETTKNDSGHTIVCSAVNFAGSTFVRGRMRVTSEDDQPPPVITLGPSNQTLPLKSMAVFPCIATGHPMPVVLWFHEGVALVQNHRRNVSDTGTLVVKDLEKSDSGLYTCVAASPNGKYVWNGVLIVDAPTNPSLNFFRAPDASTLPGAPSKPHIIDYTENSITIGWKQNYKIGSSSLIGYQVEMFARDLTSGKDLRNTNGWVKLTQRYQDTNFTAKDLSAGSSYMFLVRAENSHGLSPPSAISEPFLVGKDADNVSEIRSNLMTDEIVQLTEATPIDSVTIKVMWQVLNFLQLEGLFIYYRPLDSSQWTNDYQMKTILHSNDVSGFEVTNLEKYTEYELFLIPFYKKFEGKPSNSRVTRTLDDIPAGPPTNIEMFIMNTTTVHLKWSPPISHLQNGQITGYNVLVNWLDVLGNKSMVAINTTVHAATSLIMANLTSGVSYSVQVAAGTVVGFGPFSPPIYLNIESNTIGYNPITRYPMSSDVSIVAGDFVMETWVLLLIVAIAILKVILIGTFIFFRKHNLFTKKASLPNIYDSNGTSLVTQMNIKAAVSLSHPLSSCYGGGGGGKAESLLWAGGGGGGGGGGAEYDRVAQPLPEYAEVAARAPDWNTTKTATSPAAYASVTLVTNTRQCVSSLGWFPQSNKKTELDSRYTNDEELYPASNGGYYNRNVYADKPFQHPGAIKFYDLPGAADAQKAQLRYNIDDRRPESPRSELAGRPYGLELRDQSPAGRPYGLELRDQSPAGRPYGLELRDQSPAGRPYGPERKAEEPTYRAFSNTEESDEENYVEEADYGNLREPSQRGHLYARPAFESDPSRTLGRLTSFRKRAEPAYGASAPGSTYEPYGALPASTCAGGQKSYGTPPVSTCAGGQKSYGAPVSTCAGGRGYGACEPPPSAPALPPPR